ncbi:nudC domain-containing protein 3-like [Stegodyphus dumicola]|uniref:nudC domain-containing protein 3-like n=1 Tax=Stegodyphus dumicola TaxID=202533 RepID=UPI0015AF17F8|nr:nudC domain-containing protein 3-like [Stegodyphus dumicola]
MSSEKNYDDLLYPILSSEGNIVGFFDRVFDFLYRRTDFFRLKSSESSDLGLPDGEAEQIVRCVFCKYMEQAVLQQKSESQYMDNPVPLDYVAEETVVTTSENEKQNSAAIESISSNMKEEKNENKRLDDQSDPKIPLMDPDCYNGAHYEGYSWAQTLRDIDVRVKVPANVTSAKQVHVNIRQTSLSTEALSNNEWNQLKGGDLTWKVNVEESTWTLVPREHIHICLQKIQERWWDSLFVGEPKIDLKTIDPSIAYEDLDQDSQTKIEQLMYNEHLKRLGKPTIQQNKFQTILKEAWNRDGSPFKGHPYDPGLVNIQNADNMM